MFMIQFFIENQKNEKYENHHFLHESPTKAIELMPEGVMSLTHRPTICDAISILCGSGRVTDVITK